MNNILTVSDLTDRIQGSLEKNFPFVWVQGEVTNLSRPASGHIYFSLKDAGAQLQCVWFLGSQRKNKAGKFFDALTGEVFEAEKPDPRDIIRNGMEMLCGGTISVYSARGQYQLLVQATQAAGAGLLALALEERKKKLAALGYFAQERKRRLPHNPCRIALVTSPHGAAIHDFIKLARQRGLSSIIRLFPVRVQGEGAAADIADAIRMANAQDWAEVIVLVRGGGSLEDLWAFNDEALAEAVFYSELPVLAGIGHEIDITIADMTADVRAATPSHAAQLLWPLRRELMQTLDELCTALEHAITSRLSNMEKMLAQASGTLAVLSPMRITEQMIARGKDLDNRLNQATVKYFDATRMKLETLENRRSNCTGLNQQLNIGKEKMAWLSERYPESIKRILVRKKEQANLEDAALENAWINAFTKLETRCERLSEALEAANPLRPLQKGYAYLYNARGILRSVAQCKKGERLEARLADGYIEMTVDSIRKEKDALADR